MPDLPATRQSLLLELGRRSDAAWAEFLGVYEQAIYRVCRSKGLQDADARDVTQEVLAAVHARVADWDQYYYRFLADYDMTVTVDGRKETVAGDMLHEYISL